MNLATQHKVDILRYPSWLLHHWNLNVSHPVWIELFFLAVLRIESELGTAEDLSLELDLTVLEDMLECLVEVLETGVEHLSLESGFELLKENAFLDDGNIVSKLLTIEISNSTEDWSWKHHTFPGLVKLDKPKIDEFFLLVVLILLFKTLNEWLKSTDHVTEETNSSHFYEHLEEVFSVGQSYDISVTHGREWSNNPVERSNIEWKEIIQLNSFGDETNDPAIIIVFFFELPEQDPNVS